MNRDIVCLARLSLDNYLPKKIRNSYALFWLASSIFRLPKSLYTFRRDYARGVITELSIFYGTGSDRALARVSKDTDLNSIHLSVITKICKELAPLSILDVGCGSGYMLERLALQQQESKCVGIDFKVPVEIKKNSLVQYIEGDLYEALGIMKDNSFDFVVCGHVIEHLEDPERAVFELRRVCNKKLILVCPQENEFEWGFNYHVNFFPSIHELILLLNDPSTCPEMIKSRNGPLIALGDYLVVEEL